HRRWPQVLAHGEDVRPLRRDVAHRRDHFVMRLAEANHDPALAYQVGRALLGPAKHLERTLVARLWTNARVEARNGLDVVIQDLWPCGEDRVERLGTAHEVRDQHLDCRAWRL